jgi:ABC-type xylose transport system permease subunit
MNVIQRMQAPTPKFFKVLRNVGLALAAASGALLAAPVALPAAVITLAGYLAVAGTVVTAVSQTAVAKEGNEESERDDDGP